MIRAPSTEPLKAADYPGVRVEYWERPYRLYLVNGRPVPSVTTILGVLGTLDCPGGG